MPTRAFTARFYEQWSRLPGAQREAYRRARTRFFAHLVEPGFHPPFPAGLRVRRLQGTASVSDKEGGVTLEPAITQTADLRRARSVAAVGPGVREHLGPAV